MGNLSWKQVLKRVRETKRGFTLLELLVVLTVVLVLSTIAMYIYQRGLAHARETVCQTNLRALHEAITLYSTENDALPASLGHLKLEHLERGFAKAMEGREWLIKAYTFLIKLDTSDHAYAQFLTYDNLKKYGASKKIFHCPGDHNGGASYAINSQVQGKTWTDIPRNTILVADCDNYTFSTMDQLAKRHRHKALGIIKSAILVEVREDQEPVPVEKEEKPKEGDDDDDDGDDDDDDDGDDDKKHLPTNLDQTVKFFDDLVNKNLDTPTADKAEDVRNKLLTAVSELSKSSPDIPAAQGNIEGARGDLQAMIDDQLIDRADGLALMNLLSRIENEL